MFEIVKGNLFDPEFNFDALAQGVNTYGVMGAGIAVPFRENWPVMYNSYRKLCKKHGETLGGLIHIWDNPENTFNDLYEPTIYNLFSQISPGKDGSYTLLKKAAILMRQDADKRFNRVGLPWIGCGIAGLERHNVAEIFTDVLGDSIVEFVLVEQ